MFEIYNNKLVAKEKGEYKQRTRCVSDVYTRLIVLL